LAVPDTPPPWLHSHYRASQLLRGGPPPCSAFGTLPLAGPQLEALPSWSGRYPEADHPDSWAGTPRPAIFVQSDRFSRSTPEPKPSSRRLYAGHHLGGKQIFSQTDPEEGTQPSVLMSSKKRFDTSSAVHLRSPSWLTPDTLLVRLFHTIYNPGSLPAQRMVVWYLLCKTAPEGLPPSLM
jgi:hypothetical protein